MPLSFCYINYTNYTNLITHNDKNLKNKGENIMKTNELNKIQNTQNAEVKAAEALAAKKSEEEILNAVKPEDFLDLLERVYSNEIKMITDDQNNIIGLNISKATGVNVVKVIGGKVILGASEEEAAADELEQKKFEKAYAGKPVKHWYELALQLKAGNYRPDAVAGTDHNLIFILANERKAIDENGNTVLTVDVPQKTPTSVIVELIKTKLAEKELGELKDYNQNLQKLVVKLNTEIRCANDTIKRLSLENDNLKTENKALKIPSVQSRTMMGTPMTTVELDLNGGGYCSIVLCEHLKTMTLENAILSTINNNKNLIAMTREENPYMKGAKFIANRIMSNIPIEANSKKELHSKLSKIIYNALKDAPTLGFSSNVAGCVDSDPAMEISDKIATTIMANAIINC